MGGGGSARVRSHSRASRSSLSDGRASPSDPGFPDRLGLPDDPTGLDGRDPLDDPDVWSPLPTVRPCRVADATNGANADRAEQVPVPLPGASRSYTAGRSSEKDQ